MGAACGRPGPHFCRPAPPFAAPPFAGTPQLLCSLMGAAFGGQAMRPDLRGGAGRRWLRGWWVGCGCGRWSGPARETAGRRSGPARPRTRARAHCISFADAGAGASSRSPWLARAGGKSRGGVSSRTAQAARARALARPGWGGELGARTRGWWGGRMRSRQGRIRRLPPRPPRPAYRVRTPEAAERGLARARPAGPTPSGGHLTGSRPCHQGPPPPPRPPRIVRRAVRVLPADPPLGS